MRRLGCRSPRHPDELNAQNIESMHLNRDYEQNGAYGGSRH